MTNTTNNNKRKTSKNASDGTAAISSNKNKSKKPRVSVKEEFNVEIPSDVSVITSETSSSLALSQGKGLLPPISSLLLYKPEIAANRFDPFYQSIDPYVQYTSMPGPMPKAYTTPPTFKHETGANAATATTPPVMPIIPYYFHHARFGIESCMRQLEHHIQQQAAKTYSFNSADDGVHYYYHI